MPYKLKIKQDDNPWSPREWDNLGHMVCWHSRYNLGDEDRRDDPQDWLRELACSLDPSLEERLLYWEDGHGWTRLINEAKRIVTENLDRIDADVAATKLGYVAGASDYHLARLATERKNWPWYRANKMASEKSDKRITAAIMAVIDKHTVMLPLYLYDHSGLSMNTGGFSCPWDSGQVGYIYATREAILKEFSVKKLTEELRAKVERILRGEVKTYSQYLEGDVYGYVIYEIDEECDCDPEPWLTSCTCTSHAEVVDSCWGYFGSDDALEEGRSVLKHYEELYQPELNELAAGQIGPQGD